MRRKLRIAAFVAVPVVLVLVVAGCLGAGPLSAIGVDERRVEPRSVALLGQGGDPLVVMVRFPWPGDGFCSGQFHVEATESATQVRVGTVVSRVTRWGGTCAGLGTVDGMAAAELRLSTPLGLREVVRARDGARLPVLVPPGS